MIRSLRIVATITGFLAFGSPSVATQDDELQTVLQTEVEQSRETAGYPGLTVAIVLPDDRAFTAAAGWVDFKRNVLLQPTDRMPAGSVGKTFVAAAVLKAVENGQLDLDTKIERWLGHEHWFARIPNAHDLTLRRLLSHRTGIPDADPYPFLAAISHDLDKTWTAPELVGFVLGKKPLARAGTKFTYSDMNYVVAGLVYEEATGHKLFADIDQQLLGPLGLDQTVTAESRRMEHVVPGRMHYPLRGESIRDGRFVYNTQMEYAGGGLVSTPRDLARWAKLLFDGTVIGQPLLAQMLDGKPVGRGLAYGLGVGILPTSDGPLYWHSGWIFGYQTVVFYLPSQRLAAALQINSDPRQTFKIQPETCLARIVTAVLRTLQASSTASGVQAPSAAQR